MAADLARRNARFPPIADISSYDTLRLLGAIHMRFKVPTPLHGWGELAWEVGIIVIGVLLALAAQQIVAEFHDRSVAAETRAELTDELNSNLVSMALRERAGPCIDRRLNELRSILTQWQLTESFTTPQWVAQTPVIEVELGRFDAALTAGRMTLLSGEEQYRMGAVAARIRRFNELQFDERLVWGRLRALQAGPEALSSEDQAMIRAALQDASTLDYEVRVNIRQALPMAKSYGFRPDQRSFREIAPQVWAGGKYSPSICTSINTPRDQANKTQVTRLPL